MIIEEFQKTGDKNLFEEVIDRMMLENFDEKFKEKIMGMSKSEKRMAILSLLDKDRNLFMKIRSLVTGNKVSKTEHLKDVILFLREYVKVEPGERKKLGQVFTPLDLGKEMVNLIDKYDENFWKNPNHTVLDSSAGFGTFLVLAAYKFMNGLQEWEPDDGKRFKWIVENCLYYGDIDPKSVFLWLCLIDPYDEYETNTYWGSYLTEDFDKHAKEVWGVEKWSAIIQNPPYQMRKEGFKKTQPLWHLFVQKSLTLLKNDGYMVMVHPSGWRNIDGIFKETQNLLKSNQILEIHIHNESDGSRIFGATTGFDYYIIKNTPYKNVTKILGNVEGSIDLRKLEFIPSGDFDIYERILAREDDDRCQVYYSRSAYGTDKSHMSRERSNINIHPCVYTIQKDGTINLFWSNTNRNGHFSVPKVIWSNGKASIPIVDIDGKFGLTQFSYAIMDEKENLEGIRKAMNSDKFINMMKNCDMNDGNRFNRKIIATFRKDFWKEFIK